MALLETDARNAAANAVTAMVNSGDMQLLSAGEVVLATLSLAATAFGDAVAGVATANGLPLSSTGAPAAGSGTAITQYRVRTSGGAVRWSGTVASGELTLINVNIADGQEVTITSFTHTQPAGT